MHSAIRERSERDDRTMAQTIRRAVRLYLAAEEPPEAASWSAVASVGGEM